ncbi:ATP-binding protein [Pseudonocardia adelaidensis]|uniref:Helix-turn-helix transcriptional regulator n=1 Tax=Pseudonocardia adelaidensis TaxID=648754 RepID=A0ABP9NI87_9PSEU
MSGGNPGGFVGRNAELVAVAAAYARAEQAQPTALFVTGDAGIGKSRLVAEFRGTATDALVLVGRCLDLVPAAPYGPLVSMLRSLVRKIGMDRIRTMCHGGAAGELARLMPGLGTPPADGEGVRARLMDAVLVLFEKLAAEAPLVVVIEDAHWIDRASWDVLSYLIHNSDASPIMFVVTHRELPRGHPLRAPIADLGCREQVTVLPLDPLDRAAVAQQATAILGHEPSADRLDDLVRRSGGNPLFVEALLGTHGDARFGDGPVRDLLLAPVERLPPLSRDALRVAAVGGAGVGHRLLAAVSGMSEEALDEALRPAVGEGVLVATADGYRFRHDLIAEAIYDVLLLPVQRHRLHRQFATLIEADPGLAPPVLAHAPSEAARHWEAAAEWAAALGATWRAARDSRGLLAHSDRLHMLERVLAGWSRVQRPDEVIGVGRAAVLREAVEAAHESGEAETGLRLADEALDAALAVGAHRLAALVLERRARIRRHLGIDGAVADIERALQLVPEQPPSTLRCRLLGYLAYRLRARGNRASAYEVALQAEALAGEVGDGYGLANSLVTLAGLEAEEGDLDLARSGWDRALEIARRERLPMLVVHTYLNQSASLATAGELDASITAARRGVREAGTVGLARTLGVCAATNLAGALTARGSWDEALEVLAHAVDLRPPRTYLAAVQAVRGHILVARGDREAATAVLGETRSLFPSRFEAAGEQFAQAAWESELHLLEGNPHSALTCVLMALGEFAADLAPSRAWPLMVQGARALRLAEHADLARRSAVPVPENALTVLHATAGALSCRTRTDRAWRASFAAETSDRAGRWEAREAELAAWELTGQPHRIALALVESAEGCVAQRDHCLAAERLRRAIATAESLRARPLLDAAQRLANRARIEVADRPVEPPATPTGLTARERAVLQRVALGQTNRQIGQELFISAKTVSVHLSRVLTKLGAANRGEAAAIAHRLGLLSRDV